MNKLRSLTLLFAAVALSAPAQIITSFGGIKVAADYAYGYPNITGASALQINGNGGNAATGVSSITLVTGAVALSSGGFLYPLSVTAPITVGTATNRETVTPTGVSGCNQNPIVVATCVVTANFANLHGASEPVISGTYGLQEAINAAAGGTAVGSAGGGAVALTPGWVGFGGTNATITAATPFSNVYLIDNRGIGTNATHWSMQPSTLTVIPAASALTATNVVFTSATGTWAASSTHFCFSYIDALGGESACSADYTQTPTVNFTLTVSGIAASTGAVGYRVYAGTTSAATSYLLPITSANCTLATLETVVPACAIGSTGTWAATFTTTAPLAPVVLGVTNTNNPVPQSHTTFAYSPTGSNPLPFQTNYGPFGSGTIASATAADVTPLGTIELPAGFLNTIGRTVRFTGKVQGGATASGTMAVLAGLVWSGTGITAGAPVPVCDTVSASLLGTQNYTFAFSCTMTTNAVSATDAATIQPDSFFIAGGAAGTTNVVAGEANLVAVTTLNVSTQDELTFYITPGASAVTAARLMDLHVEVLQ